MRNHKLALLAGLVGILALVVLRLGHREAASGAALLPAGPTAGPAKPEPELDAPATSTETVEPARVAAAGATVPEETEPAPPSKWVLAVRFVDARGAPVEGVQFWPGDGEPEGDVTSGPNGVAELEFSWPYRGRTVGGGRVPISAGGTRFARHWDYVPMKGPGRQDLGTITIYSGGSITGRVLDPSGQPVGRPSVSVIHPFQHDNAALVEEARTHGWHIDWQRSSKELQEDGRFVAHGVPVGSAAVCARTSGTLFTFSREVEVVTGESVSIGDLLLERAGPENLISGRVEDEHGEPLAKVTIELDQGKMRSYGVSQRTAEDGTFELVVPRDREYPLRFTRKDNRRRIDRVVPAGTRDLLVQFTPEHSFVVVPRTIDGTIVPDARLHLYDTESSSLPIEATTDPDGSLRARLPDEPFKLWVSAEGWTADREWHEVLDPETVGSPFEVVMLRAYGIRGQVFAGGEPAADVPVHVHTLERGISDDGFVTQLERGRSYTRTDQDGAFFAQLSSAGTYVVHAEVEGFVRAESAPIEFREGSDVSGVELSARPGGSITGRVLTAPGVSPAGAVVGAGNGDRHVATTEVGEDGVYRFDDLSPGRWQVLMCDPDTLRRLESGTFMYLHDDAEIEWQVEVSAGGTANYDLDLTDRIPTSIRGRLAFDGRPAAQWGCYSGRQRAPLDADGWFELRWPTAEATWLNFNGGSRNHIRLGFYQEIQLEPGRNEWHVDLPTGSIRFENLPKLDLRHSANGERSLPHYGLIWAEGGSTWTAALYSAGAGSFLIEDVPAGVVRLVQPPEDGRYRWDFEGYPLVEEITVHRGAVATIQLP